MPVHPEDLAGHNAPIYSLASKPEEWSFTRAGENVQVKVAGNVRVNNGDYVLAAAIEGCGIGLLPTFIVFEALQDGRLVSVLDEWQLPAVGIHALYPQTRALPAKTRALIDFLVEHFGPEPHWERVCRECVLRGSPVRTRARLPCLCVGKREGVGVHPRRKAFPVGGQDPGIEVHGDHLFLRAEFDQRLAEEIEGDAVARVRQVIAVGADAVDADAIAQVLDRARAQQGRPCMPARRRPVGDEHQQVVVEALRLLRPAVAQPDREAQVVADLRADRQPFRSTIRRAVPPA